MTDEPGLPRPGEVVGDAYRVEQPIGSGGMGAVFRARHEPSGRAVALKWLRPALAAEPLAARRFVREAQASARIRHPNVVEVLDVGEHEGRAFLVLELLEGETLRARLRRGELDVAQCIALLLPAMRGVAAAHAQGVIHRDLKPDNLFLARDPEDPESCVPKVLDFGISKLAADSPLADGTLTATGATLGTPHYMSLEQLQGAEVDVRTDVYSCGVLLYECLTGRRPFDSENFSAIVVKVATEAPLDPCLLRPGLAPALRDVVLKAMAREREQRHGSIDELASELEPFAGAAARDGEPACEAAPAGTAQLEPTRDARAARPFPKRGGARTRWLLAAVAGTALTGAAVRLLPWRGPATAPKSAAAAPATKPPARDEGASRASAERPQPTGADAPALADAPAGRRFDSGWVYLGEFSDGRWVTRYFDGWNGGLPRRGARITARGRSNVRFAMPSAEGLLGAVHTTVGGEDPLELLGVARWQGGGYVWARVRPAF